MIKYLLFDLDGTLFDFEKAEKCAFENTLHHFEIEGDYDKYRRIYSEINLNLWKLFEKNRISSSDLRIKRFADFLHEISIERDPDLLSKYFIADLGNHRFLLPNAKEILIKLDSKFTMLLITNGLSEVQRKRLAKSEITSFFKSIIISDEVGSPKPNPQIFEHTLAEIGNPSKDKVLIIGDSASSDILGGFNFGIQTCWYNPDKNDFPLDFSPTFEIHNLLELEEILCEN